MLRGALACCALIGCKGTPPEDKRAPAQAPVALEVPADAAAPPDAPSEPCFAFPLLGEAERAGIRPLAHHVPPPSTAKPAPVRDVIKLVIGKPTVLRRLRPPAHVPAVANADGLLVKTDTAKVTVNAPAYLEGAVVEVAGDDFALVAIGDAGLASLARYREHYLEPRLAATPVEGDDKVRIAPVSIMLDDLDGDGVLEQVSFSRVGFLHKDKDRKIRDSELELGVLWSTGELASVRICCGALDAPKYFVVPPNLSGGKVTLVSLAGDRVVLDGKTLTKLPAAETGGGKRCLQTSSTVPATIFAPP